MQNGQTEQKQGFLKDAGFECSVQMRHGLEVVCTVTPDGHHDKVILSSLPSQTLPEISAPALPEITSVPPIQPSEPSVQQQAQGVYGRMYRQEAPTITNGPALPQVPRAVSQPRFQQRSAQQHTHNSSRDYRMPTVIRDTDSDKKEGGLSASTVTIIIFVLFVFILHGCD